MSSENPLNDFRFRTCTHLAQWLSITNASFESLQITEVYVYAAFLQSLTFKSLSKRWDIGSRTKIYPSPGRVRESYGTLSLQRRRSLDWRINYPLKSFHCVLTILIAKISRKKLPKSCIYRGNTVPTNRATKAKLGTRKKKSEIR